MTDILKGILDWLSVGPLKGYRTKVLAGLQFILAGAYAINLGNIKAHVSTDQMLQWQLLLSGAMGLAAADHGMIPPKP